MHQSPLKSPHGSPTTYDNGKTKPSNTTSDGRMIAVILVFAFIILCFAGLVWQVSSLTSSANAMDKRLGERATADHVFWGEWVGRGKPFVDVIPRSQFTVERGHALEYTTTYNIKECADRCIANDRCVAFSFVKPHKKEDRFESSRPNRCILVGGHYTSTKLEDATIVRRDPKVVARLRQEREDRSSASGGDNDNRPVFVAAADGGGKVRSM